MVDTLKKFAYTEVAAASLPSSGSVSLERAFGFTPKNILIMNTMSVAGFISFRKYRTTDDIHLQILPTSWKDHPQMYRGIQVDRVWLRRGAGTTAGVLKIWAWG